MRHIGVAAAIAAITLLGFFVFPGHTWLQSDTQIYVPIFERIWDPAVFGKDIIAVRPHVAWTIYDETALGLRAVLRAGFKEALIFEQLLFRALAVFGIYLIGRRFHESPPVALLTAAILSLGATINGPAVLSFEYEPVPRGFAVSLLFCAIGLAIHGETVWASVAASAAFLYHAPTTVPFWIVFGAAVVHGRRWAALIPPVAAFGALAVMARLQPGAAEAQHFFTRIPPVIEMLQRLRAPYNWVSLWPAEYLWQHLVVWAAGVVAMVRLRERLDFTARLFLAGIPLVGLLSIPLSWMLLEQMKLALIPQWQPARAVLFTTVLSLLLCALAAAVAAEERRYAAAFAWLVLPFLIPVHKGIWAPYPGVQLALVALLAAGGVAAFALRRGQAVAAVFAAAVFLIPGWARVENYARLHSAALEELSRWARTSTAQDAVFLFPKPGKDLRPGIFRAESLRAVYVDWKAGGQVNYFDDLGIEWWSRWQRVDRGEIPAGVDYIVYMGAVPEGARKIVFRNAGYAVAAAR